MPRNDASTRQLLVRLGISTRDWQKTIADIKKQLKEMNVEALKDHQERLSRQQQELEKTKQQIADQKRLQAEARTMAELDRAKAQWQKQKQEALRTETAEIVKQTAQSKQQANEEQTLLKIEQQKLSIQKQEVALHAQKLRLAQQEARHRESAEPSFLGSLAQGVFGGGFAGQIAAGAASGAALGTVVSEAAVRLLESAKEKISKLAEAMLEATGPAQQLREQFEKLARRSGEKPDELLSRLRTATRNLVDDVQLYRIANNFMQQGMKVTNDDIVKMIGNTLNLARAQGKTAVEAMNALQRASLSGRTQTLAWVVGLTAGELRLKGLSGTMDETTRKTLEFEHTQALLAQRLREVGVPATTLPELFTQVRLVQKNFIDDVASSMVKTQGFKLAMQQLSEIITQSLPTVQKITEWIGTKLGEAFTVVGPLARVFVAILHAMGATVTGVYRVGTALLRLTGAMDDMTGKQSLWRTFIGNMSMGFLTIAEVITESAIHAEQGGKVFKAVLKGNLKAARQAIDDANNEIRKSREQYLKDTMNAAKFKLGLDTDRPDTATKHVDTTENIELAKQIAELKLKIREQEIKAELEMRLAAIEREKEANKDAYDSGLESLQDYLNKQRKLLDAEHIARLDQLKAERDARLAELAQQAKGQTIHGDDGKETQVPGMAPEILALKRKEIIQQFNTQVIQESARVQKEQYGLVKQGLEDEIAARREYVSAVNKINQTGVQERIKQNEEEFKSGGINAEEYIATRRSLLEEQRDLANQAAQETYDAGKKNDVDLAKRRASELDNEIKFQAQITELVQKEGDYRLQYLNQRFDQAKKLLESQIKLESRPGSPDISGLAIPDQRALIDITERHIQSLVEEQQKLGPLTEANADDWLKISTEINTSRDQIAKLNTEIEKSRNIAGGLGDIFGQIAKDFGDILPKGWQQTLNKISEALKMLQKFREEQAAVGRQGGLLGSIGHSIADLFRPVVAGSHTAQTALQLFERSLRSTQQSVSSTFHDADTSVDTFKTTVSTAANQMTAFAQTAADAINKIQGAQGEPVAPTPVVPTSKLPDEIAAQQTPAQPTQAAAAPPEAQSHNVFATLMRSFASLGKSADKTAGAQDNAATKTVSFGDKLGSAIQGVVQIASSIGQTVSTISSAQSPGQGAFGGAISGLSTGAMFGPIGAGVGAVVGGVLGGIVGAKRQEAAQDAEKIKNQLQAIVDQLNSGTITLGDAINTLRRQRQAAIDTLSGDKKGSSQLPAVLQQFDAEIQKLLDAQKQVLDNMNQEIITLQQPTAFQPIIQQLDEIIKKYQQFSSAAAGSAAEVAAANEWLTLSLKNYATTVAKDLNTANETAVNDALHLLDLEKQRYDLIQSEAKQEYDIMTQGVLQRQRGGAAEKGYQIAQLRYQRDQQLAQMNEEYALTQYKVSSEQKIFDLAQTRLGLEAQLLALQETQVDQQVAGVQAMQQAMEQITAAIASGNLPQAITSGGTLTSGSSMLDQIIQALGLTPGSYTPPDQITAQTDYMSAIPQQYRNAVQNINNIYPNFLRFVIEGQQGMQKARDLSVQMMGAFWNQLSGWGVDRNQFMNWLKVGTLPANTPVPPGVANPITGKLPGFEEGTPYVERTGLALLHEGEAVIPKRINPGRPGVPVDNIMPSTRPRDVVLPQVKSMEEVVSKHISDLKLTAENKILDMAQTRAQIEMSVINARMQLLQAESAHLANMAAYNSNTKIGVASVEGGMQKVYELRGRYGSGGFTRQTI